MKHKKEHDNVTRLVNHHFGSSGGELIVGDMPVRSIAARQGTPVFVYDRNVLDRQLALLRRALPTQFSVFYSIKANPHLAFLKYFLSKDCGLEIASGGELHRALQAGSSPDRIVFAGPGKSEEELELALTHGIGELHAESRLEIDRIHASCSRLGLRGKIALRVNPTGEAEGGAMRMGGKPAPFGIDEEQLDSVVRYVLSRSSLEMVGIHIFAGTQNLDATILAKQYRKGVQIARRVTELTRRPLRTLDFGGGLGIPYFKHESPLDLKRFGEALNVLTGEIQTESFLANTQLIVEPGRFLVGESGIYVTRVTDIKVSRGNKYLIVDGGMHHHLAASGNLGQTIKRNYPIAILNKLQDMPEERVDVVGPLCTPLDVLARGVTLPRAEVGDLVGVFQSGAYARTASPLEFLSHRKPPEVWVEGGHDYLITRPGRYDESLERESIPMAVN